MQDGHLARDRFDVYWANAMFSEADRRFNDAWVTSLRTDGYRVFLPQETPVNALVGPSAADIFRGDTEMVYRSACLVACIDQETIDCGVAAEMALAYTIGLPIIGVYTDIRRHRRGRGQMYKNLYVLGMLEASGGLVETLEELRGRLRQMLSPRSAESPPGTLTQAHRYGRFVSRLEAWYRPPWTAVLGLSRWLEEQRPQTVLEFGCGPGTVAAGLLRRWPSLIYVGYDHSGPMVEAASESLRATTARFTSNWGEVRRGHPDGFDAAVLSFVLHDVDDPARVLGEVAETVRRPGSLLIADLTPWDLPRLVSVLQVGLALPVRAPDPRLTAPLVARWADELGARSVDIAVAAPGIAFPSKRALSDFVSVFGIDRGADLPLDLRADGGDARRLASAISKLAYPFEDRRSFLTARIGLA
jgi:SAM-dependent methyltransferase/nucleoside 2-deoxyribosyltransferase